MGSRGAFNPSLGPTGGIPASMRDYSTIGHIGKIKIVQCNTKTNNPTITYSNTCNTTYFSYSKENRRIEHIYYYKNHKLAKSVDFKDNETPHTHYWNQSVVGRKRHDGSNRHELSDRDKRLMKLAQKYNEEHERK